LRILGIHDGHTATACYLEDGRIRSVISEERLTGVKGQGGFPSLAVQRIFSECRIAPDDLDAVALVGNQKPLVSIDQYRQGRQKLFPLVLKAYPGDPRMLIKRVVGLSARFRLKDTELQKRVCEVGISPGKLTTIDHHQTHAACAYCLSPFHSSNQRVLVITLDGSGDGMAGSISVVDANGKWTRLRDISTYDSIGMVYSRVTQYLAMKPWEHEYKLMGMAPYADQKIAARVCESLRSYLRLTADGLGFENVSKLWGNSFLEALYRQFKGIRFDAVAAGVQLHFERLVVEWISRWIQKTGIRRLAVSGGCFMNVKANRLLLTEAGCDALFVMPSSGDDSCAIGAAIAVHQRMSPGKPHPIQPLGGLYWGPGYDATQIASALDRWADKVSWRSSEDIESETARLLADHQIVGRLSGRMEWGARALGNRSILANPSRMETIQKLNAAIKMRDFWMPFAPSILWECRNDYAVLPKDHASCYMTMAYESTDLARRHLIAALHPYDFTLRPQFVRDDHNPQYARLLRRFHEKTGIGGVLNTSFNLHGYPIVCRPEDAIRTFLNSDLDYLTLNQFLVWKTPEDRPVA
jgi:carbamoyltransferase